MQHYLMTITCFLKMQLHIIAVSEGVILIFGCISDVFIIDVTIINYH